MGTSIIDKYSFHHWWMGALSYLLFDTTGISMSNNFLLTNGIHLIIELLEHNVSPDGTILESRQNHISDIIFFLIGWYISMFLQLQKRIHPTFIPFLWILFIATGFKEFYREIYPYHNSAFINGAF